MIMSNDNPLIPVRRPVSGLTADNVAQVLFNRLVSEWGLVNAKQIGAALVTKLGDETDRRKKL
jgi:hypothetical protein